LFDAYDVDGSGTLTPDEVYNIFKASLASKGEPVGTKEIRDMVHLVLVAPSASPAHVPHPDAFFAWLVPARLQVDECFRQIDVNGDGEINYEEFKTAVTNQQLMISCFVHYPTEKEPQQ
jgi:hypothetical protein